MILLLLRNIVQVMEVIITRKSVGRWFLFVIYINHMIEKHGEKTSHIICTVIRFTR